MEEVGELKCRSVNSCESTWAPIFSLTIASIFSLSLSNILLFGFTFLTIYVCFLSFDHIDGLITDRVVRCGTKRLLTILSSKLLPAHWLEDQDD